MISKAATSNGVRKVTLHHQHRQQNKPYGNHYSKTNKGIWRNIGYISEENPKTTYKMINREALQFIDDLAANNNTEWMHANKKRYESYKKEYHNLIASLLTALKPLDESLEPLEIKNCTFRINRDIRFSKDKSPYKTNIGIWIAQNKSDKNSAGYYVHYQKGKSFIAGGIWCPEPAALKKIRREIAFFYEDLNAILADAPFKNEFGDFTVEDEYILKKAPKDFDPNHPAIEYLKMKSFTAVRPIDDKLFTQPDFTTIVAKKLIALKPLNDFLSRALETEE